VRGHERGRTFHVAPTGDDTAAGSRARPWRTLALSMARLRAGDRLVVRGGVYRERVKLEVPHGTPDRRITVVAAAGEQPVVVGQLWIGGARHWTIDGIDVTWDAGNPPEPMVRMYGGTGWVLRDAEIWGARATSALHVDDGPDADLGRWRVVGNCIHDTVPTNGPNQDHNIYVDDMSASTSPHGLIEDNVVYGAPNGRGIKLGPGGRHGGARNVVIRGNTIANGIANIGVSQATTNVAITGNVLLGARDASITAFELRGRDIVAARNVAGLAPRFVDDDSGHVRAFGNRLHVTAAVEPSCAALRASGRRLFAVRR
jgi:hypothetical protein